jgi:L-rhamnose mutarotase
VQSESRKRICFCLQVKPERIAEYKTRHAAVWPEMLNALSQAGWHNYSLFLREDGLLVGYLETPDLGHALRQMAAAEINSKWQAEMAGFFEGSGVNADQQIQPIEQVFHLP